MSKNEVKFALVGDSGVGKTCVLGRFMTNQFASDSAPTAGGVFTKKTVVLNNQPVKFQIWDTAGQEKYRSLTQTYYRQAQCILVIYDVTKKKSFESINYWVNEIIRSGENYQLAVVGNKNDQDYCREVQKETGEEYARSINAPYFECSAQTGDGVLQVFEEMAKRTLKGEHQKKVEGVQVVTVKRVGQKKEDCCQ